MKELKHGGAGTAYSHYGCRCEECKEANRIRVAKRKKQRYLETKDPNDPRHGSSSFYSNHGCRCEKCSEAARIKNHKAYMRRKEDQ